MDTTRAGRGGVYTRHGDGIRSADEIAALRATDGPTASTLIAKRMIVHHEGAVNMAETHLDEARNAEVHALAAQLSEDQRTETERMLKLPGGRGAARSSLTAAHNHAASTRSADR